MTPRRPGMNTAQATFRNTLRVTAKCIIDTRKRTQAAKTRDRGITATQKSATPEVGHRDADILENMLQA